MFVGAGTSCRGFIPAAWCGVEGGLGSSEAVTAMSRTCGCLTEPELGAACMGRLCEFVVAEIRTASFRPEPAGAPMRKPSTADTAQIASTRVVCSAGEAMKGRDARNMGRECVRAGAEVNSAPAVG